jgi:hypothetical protein
LRLVGPQSTPGDIARPPEEVEVEVEVEVGWAPEHVWRHCAAARNVPCPTSAYSPFVARLKNVSICKLCTIYYSTT